MSVKTSPVIVKDQTVSVESILPTAGKVKKPIQNGNGIPVCFVHENNANRITYDRATHYEAMAYAASVCPANERQELMDSLVELLAEMEAKDTIPAAGSGLGRDVVTPTETVKPAVQEWLKANQPAAPATPATPVKPAATEPAKKNDKPAAEKKTPVKTAANKPAATEPAKQPAAPATPAKKLVLPESYKDLMGLGSEGVKELAARLKVDVNLPWAKLLKATWTAVKAAAESKPAATATNKPAEKPAKKTAAPVLMVKDGKAYRQATIEEIEAALASMKAAAGK